MCNYNPGQLITFDIEIWIGERMEMKEVESQILRVDVDPCGIREPKCIVKINNGDYGGYGIPFSQVKSFKPAIGEQLQFF
jgi:hypothetical protein